MTDQSTTVAQGPTGTTTTQVTSGLLPSIQTGGSTGTGILGSLVGAAQTIYNIIKDSGLAVQFSSTATAAGASAGFKADDTRKPELVGSYAISGVWYTHTRVFGTLLNRGTTPHEKARTAKKFKSTYLCSVYPYQITWDLYRAVTPQAKPMKQSEVSAKNLEFAKVEQELYGQFYTGIEDYKPDDVSIEVTTVIPPKSKRGKATTRVDTVKYRVKKPGETDEKYLEFLKKLSVNDKSLASMIQVLDLGLKDLKEQRDEFAALVQDMLNKSQLPPVAPELVFANIQLRPISEASGVKARFPQNIKVNAQFQINARSAKPWGFEVMLNWSETAIGYGYPGVPGSFHVRQDGADAGTITITPNGKLGRRFNQFFSAVKTA